MKRFMTLVVIGTFLMGATLASAGDKPVAAEKAAPAAAAPTAKAAAPADKEKAEKPAKAHGKHHGKGKKVK